VTVRGTGAGLRAGWPIVIALGFGVFIGGFDQTFVVPVLTNMLGDLNVSLDKLEQASWILNGYLLGYTVALPLMGRMADVHGHFRIFVIGMLIFMGGSVIVALAPNLAILTIARAITALGGGALVPVGLAIASHSLKKSHRTMGIAAISTLDDASSLAGPLWGTLIGVWLGWRGLFWMNIVLALPILILVLFLARKTSAPPRANEKVDYQGGLLLSAALAALTFAIAGAGESLTNLWAILSLYAAAAIFFALFTVRQLRVESPLIDMRMFRLRRIAIANIVFLLEGMALITALVSVPLLADHVWGLNGAGPGLMLGRMVLFMAVGGIVGGALATIAGYRITTLISFCIAAAGLFAMASWGSEPSQIALWVSLALAGLGFTLADASLYSTVMEGVEAGRRASATAVLQVWQTLGMVIGMALLGSQGLNRFGERTGEIFEQGVANLTQGNVLEALRQTLTEMFFIAALLMVAAAVLSLGLGSNGTWGTGRKNKTTHAPIPADPEHWTAPKE
tara:strand:- start:11339 stop:12865 length:1527 start_codon:yes stop_codon:yes gene_type:complete